MKKYKALGILAKMMLNCKEATKLISKQQDSTLSIKEWMNLKIHLMSCYLCRRYEKQLLFISEKLMLHKSMDNDSDFFRASYFMLNNDQKNRMKKRLLEHDHGE